MTKYCSYFLKNISCPNIDCVFHHKIAKEKDCFWREKTFGGLFMVPNNEVINFLIENYKSLIEIKKKYINKNTILPNILAGIKEVEKYASKNNIKLNKKNIYSQEKKNIKIKENTENTEIKKKDKKEKIEKTKIIENKKKFWNDDELNLSKKNDDKETKSTKTDSLKDKKTNLDNLSNNDNNLTELDKMILCKLKNKESNILSKIIR